LPTVSEQGLPGFEFVNWFGMVAPAHTSSAIVSGIQQKIAQAFRQPATQAKLVALDSTVVTSSPAAFAAFLAHDLQKWGGVLRNSGIKAE
jgi:tripartite-type tricarboxylate transporter receptor subunit TctC